MCVIMPAVRALTVPPQHVSTGSRQRGQKKEVLSCLSEQLNSVVSEKAPCRVSPDSLAQALLCQFSISPGQCQNHHAQSSWGTPGENPIQAIQEATIKTKDYHPAHLEAANVMSCLEKTVTTSNSSLTPVSAKPEPAVPGWAHYTRSRSCWVVESLTPAHFHILQTWLCLCLELFPAPFSLRGSSATLRMLHLKTDASSCQQMQNGSSPRGVICPRSHFGSVAICNFFTRIYGILVHILNFFAENFWWSLSRRAGVLVIYSPF